MSYTIKYGENVLFNISLDRNGNKYCVHTWSKKEHMGVGHITIDEYDIAEAIFLKVCSAFEITSIKNVDSDFDASNLY